MLLLLLLLFAPDEDRTPEAEGARDRVPRLEVLPPLLLLPLRLLPPLLPMFIDEYDNDDDIPSLTPRLVDEGDAIPDDEDPVDDADDEEVVPPPRLRLVLFSIIGCCCIGTASGSSKGLNVIANHSWIARSNDDDH